MVHRTLLLFFAASLFFSSKITSADLNSIRQAVDKDVLDKVAQYKKIKQEKRALREQFDPNQYPQKVIHNEQEYSENKCKKILIQHKKSIIDAENRFPWEAITSVISFIGLAVCSTFDNVGAHIGTAASGLVAVMTLSDAANDYSYMMKNIDATDTPQEIKEILVKEFDRKINKGKAQIILYKKGQNKKLNKNKNVFSMSANIVDYTKRKISKLEIKK